MKRYHDMVQSLRTEFVDTASISTEAVFEMWHQSAPRGDSSKKELYEFWSEVAEWALKLAAAASDCSE